MIKMHHPKSDAGRPEFWDENWSNGDFESAVRFCSIDPLKPLFDKYLTSSMLEGGCGMGQYVAYYHAKGYDVTGLDFAERTLETLKVRQPHLNLKSGDVSALPFDDESFDLYFSNGVVEHFEDGCDEALREAHRVLKPNGILMISVPYHSPLRTILAPFKWKSGQFFQYAYTVKEFSEMLQDAGFEVIETQGYSIIWGLYDIWGAPESNGRSEVAYVDIAPLMVEQPVSLLKRLVVSEDASVPILGLGVRIMRRLASNMMMYVCRK